MQDQSSIFHKVWLGLWDNVTTTIRDLAPPVNVAVEYGDFGSLQ